MLFFFGAVLVWLGDRNQPSLMVSILCIFQQGSSSWRATQMYPPPSIGKIAEIRCFLAANSAAPAVGEKLLGLP